MAYTAVSPRAGIFADQAPADAAGFYVAGSNVRFVQGRAETIGGFVKHTTQTTTGISRAITSWAQIDGQIDTAVASATAVQISQGGQLADITPYRSTGSLSSPFTTTNGSATVTVAHSGHGAITGDRVIFAGASAVNGLTLNGEFTVTKVDNNSYTITASSNASGSGSGGGSVTYQYLLSVGQVDSTFQYGWGVGTWGESTWNTARPASDTVLNARTWSLAPFGEDLLLVHNNSGVIYFWDATNGTTTRATALANAPTANLLAVAPESRHVIAFGAGGDPLKVAFSSADQPTVWTPSATNSAGDQRLIDGSEIRAAIQSRGEILVLTDTAVYSMTFVGGNFVFRFRRIGATGPICGPTAIAERDGLVAWICTDGTFYVYDGKLRQLPCPVRRAVFDDINLTQRVKINAGVNGAFGEFWWSYPSANSSEPDKVVVWAYGQGTDVWWLSDDLGRTAWDAAGVIAQPLATASNLLIYEHESGTSADGSALTTFVETGDVDINEGNDLYNISDCIPDLDLVGADADNKVDLTLKSRIYPLGAQSSNGPHQIGADTTKLSIRATGRQIAYRLASNSTKLFWRAGKQRFDVELSGGQR